MNKEEILYNEIYERTKDFGRAHFIKEIMRLQRELEQLKEIEREHQKMNGELRVENKELKKQLDEYQKELKKADNLTQICIFKGKEESKISYRKCLNILDKKEAQQKEFIKYLDSIMDWDCVIVGEILQKYKSIIGVSDEKK